MTSFGPIPIVLIYLMFLMLTLVPAEEKYEIKYLIQNGFISTSGLSLTESQIFDIVQNSPYFPSSATKCATTATRLYILTNNALRQKQEKKEPQPAVATPAPYYNPYMNNEMPQNAVEKVEINPYDMSQRKPPPITHQVIDSKPYNRDFARNCHNAMGLHENPVNGVYTLHAPEVELKPFHVYCIADPDNGTAWTVFQRRVDGHVDFNRGIKNFEHGFGAISASHWMGLLRLHVMTTYGDPQELWVQLSDGTTVSNIKYSHFAIGDTNSEYTLTVLGNDSGTVQDSLRYHLGHKFQTHDYGNPNCPTTFKSGWWFYSCFYSNLNGVFGLKKNNMGIKWTLFEGTGPIIYSHMAIRPATRSSG